MTTTDPSPADLYDNQEGLPPRRLRLARLLEAERSRRSLNGSEAADIFEVNQSTYSRWETGKSVPAKKLVPCLAEFLHVAEEDVYTLRSGDDDDAPETTADLELRQRILERQHEETRRKVDALSRRVADLTDMVDRLRRKLGPPGPEGRQSYETTADMDDGRIMRVTIVLDRVDAPE